MSSWDAPSAISFTSVQRQSRNGCIDVSAATVIGGSELYKCGGAARALCTEPGGEQSGYGWVGMRRNHDHLVTGIAAIPLMPPWLALPLLLGLVVVAWRREGQ